MPAEGARLRKLWLQRADTPVEPGIHLNANRALVRQGLFRTRDLNSADDTDSTLERE